MTAPGALDPPGAATPKRAASLVMIRPGPDGPETLMGRRAPGHRFMPNKVVFPGGRIDPEDETRGCPAPIPDPDGAVLRRYLGTGGARAAARAALRETLEETGVRLDETPAVTGRLRLLARAITPAALPIRFDAWFFLMRVPAGACAPAPPRHGELDDVAWRPLAGCAGADFHPITGLMLDLVRTRLDARAPPAPPPLVHEVDGAFRIEPMRP